MKLHHVGIAVESIAEASKRFGELLGLVEGNRYELPEFGVTALFLSLQRSPRSDLRRSRTNTRCRAPSMR